MAKTTQSSFFQYFGVDPRRNILYHTPLGYSQGTSRMKDKISQSANEKQKLLFRIKRIRGQ